MAAVPSGKPLPLFGALDTEAPLTIPAHRSRPSCKLDVISGGAGSKVLTILRKWIHGFKASIEANEMTQR